MKNTKTIPVYLAGEREGAQGADLFNQFNSVISKKIKKIEKEHPSAVILNVSHSMMYDADHKMRFSAIIAFSVDIG
mgnify:FL=1